MKNKFIPILLVLAAPFALASSARAVDIVATMEGDAVRLLVPGLYYEFSVERAVSSEGPFEPLGWRYIGCTEGCEWLDDLTQAGGSYWYRFRLIDQSYQMVMAGPIEVAIPDPASGIRDVNVHPSPFARDVRIGFRLPRGAESARVTVVDPAGRILRLIAVEGAGEREIVWDGRDERGRTLAGGVYFYAIEAGGARFTGRLLKLR